jgi:hypothetical protein
MSLGPAAGTIFSASATLPATYDEDGYGDLVPTAVGEVSNVPQFGRQWEEVVWKSLASRGEKIFKGGFSGGSLDIPMGLVDDDAGQEILIDAEGDDDAIACFVTLPTGKKYGFTALVMSFKTTPGSTTDVVTANAQLRVTCPDNGRVFVELD